MGADQALLKAIFLIFSNACTAKGWGLAWTPIHSPATHLTNSKTRHLHCQPQAVVSLVWIADWLYAAPMTDSKKKAGAKATPGRGGGTPNLNREIIGKAALAIIDRDGLDGFTVRNLATALGVFPGAIYWYVPSKSALFGEALNAFNEQISRKRGRKSWQAALRDLMGEVRNAIARHPNIAPLISATIVSNAREDLAVTEYILSVLVSAGFAEDHLVAAYNTTVCSMVGFATLEFAAAPTTDKSKWQLEVQGRLLDLDPQHFPLLAGNVRRLANKAFILRWQNGVDAPLTTSFDYYVDTMIRGLEAQLSAQKGT